MHLEWERNKISETLKGVLIYNKIKCVIKHLPIKLEQLLLGIRNKYSMWSKNNDIYDKWLTGCKANYCEWHCPLMRVTRITQLGTRNVCLFAHIQLHILPFLYSPRLL